MSDADDLPIFKPVFGKRVKTTTSSSLPRFRNLVLGTMRNAGSALRSKSPVGRARIAVRSSGASSRRVLVKVHVAPLRGAGAKAASLHLSYIQRDGVGEDKSTGVLYGVDGPVPSESFAASRRNEKHQFRMIVSPEDGAELDLELYVRRFMKQVERDLGQRLEWAAVNHYDTDNPHAHVVLRGVDHEGQEVRLPRAYVAHGLRERAQELATEELGPRPQQDLDRQRAKETGHDRFTGLDRVLEKRMTGGRIDINRRLQSEFARKTEALLVARLQHLEGLRLAAKVGPLSWAIEPAWKDELRTLGMRGDIVKQMHRALRGQAVRYEILEPPRPREKPSGAPLYGRVVKKGLADELRDAYFAVIETPSGNGCYVRLDPYVAAELREGELVRIETKAKSWRKREDVEIARIAHAQDAVCDPRDVPPSQARFSVVDVKTILHVDVNSSSRYRNLNLRETMTVDEIVTRHTRRLIELEKLGLVARRPDGAWAVSDGLLEKLDAKDKSEPQTRLAISRQPLRLHQQIEHLGPVWLDGVSPHGLAPFGLGADISRALAERERFLRQHGIDPENPRREVILRNLERAAVAREIADETGLKFLRKIPLNFRGTVVGVHESPGGGTPYVEVRAGDTFTLVAATRDLRTGVGRAVTVSCDPKGRLTVRTTDRDRGDA